MSRTFVYIGTWVALVSAAAIVRFTVLAGTESDARLPLGIGFMLLGLALLAGANMYESRRLALAAGLRGRGALGYLRGSLKTTNVDFAVDGLNGVPNEAVREFVGFRTACAYLFASLIVIVPILVF